MQNLDLKKNTCYIHTYIHIHIDLDKKQQTINAIKNLIKERKMFIMLSFGFKRKIIFKFHCYRFNQNLTTTTKTAAMFWVT